MIVKTNKGLTTGDIEKHIRYKIKGDITVEYLMKKNCWAKETIAIIDWKGLEIVLTSMPLHKRQNLLQMIHNWQHTEQQKELFARSANIDKKYHNDTLKN